jgi:hypothetical protein
MLIEPAGMHTLHVWFIVVVKHNILQYSTFNTLQIAHHVKFISVLCCLTGCRRSVVEIRREVHLIRQVLSPMVLDVLLRCVANIVTPDRAVR